MIDQRGSAVLGAEVTVDRQNNKNSALVIPKASQYSYLVMTDHHGVDVKHCHLEIRIPNIMPA